MRKFLAPLGVFVGGQIALLVVLLLFPAIGTASTNLATETAGIASTFWGWTWVVGSVRLLVFIIFEAIILWGVARAFLATRNT